MSAPQASRPAAAVVWVLVGVLAVIHWDFWFWDDRTLLFGFLPVGLAYQAAFSLAAMTVWILAVRFAWPADLEEWASRPPEDAPDERGRERA